MPPTRLEWVGRSFDCRDVVDVNGKIRREDDRHQVLTVHRLTIAPDTLDERLPIDADVTTRIVGQRDRQDSTGDHSRRHLSHAIRRHHRKGCVHPDQFRRQRHREIVSGLCRIRNGPRQVESHYVIDTTGRVRRSNRGSRQPVRQLDWRMTDITRASDSSINYHRRRSSYRWCLHHR